jgi:hypothetical protein
MSYAPETSEIYSDKAVTAVPPYYQSTSVDRYNPAGYFEYPHPAPPLLFHQFQFSPFADPIFLRVGEIATNSPAVVNTDPSERLRRAEIAIQKEVDRALSASLRHLSRAVFLAAKYGTSFINYHFDRGGRLSRIDSIPPLEMAVGAAQRDKGFVFETGRLVRYFGTSYADNSYLNAALSAELYARERVPLLSTMGKANNTRWCDKITSSMGDRSAVYGLVSVYILQLVADYKAGSEYLATQMKSGWRKDLFLKLYGRGFFDKETGLTPEIRDARAEARRKLKQLVTGETRWLDVLLLYDKEDGGQYLQDDVELVEIDVKQSIDSVVKGYLDNLERLFFQFYGAPKALLAGSLNSASTLGDSAQTFFAYESFIIGMVQPFQEQLEACLNRFIGEVYGNPPLEVKFQRVEIESKDVKVKRFETEVKTGLRTINEIRQAEYGLPEIEEEQPGEEDSPDMSERPSVAKSMRNWLKWN